MYTGQSCSKLLWEGIEKLLFNALNEGTRLNMYKRLFGVDAKKVGGDTGYAGNENRDYCKENGIQTSFVKRGCPFSEEKKEKDLVRQELARVMAMAVSSKVDFHQSGIEKGTRERVRSKVTKFGYHYKFLSSF